MTKVIIINYDKYGKECEVNNDNYLISLLNNLLEKEYKIILISKGLFNIRNSITCTNQANLVELNINYFSECNPAISMNTNLNWGANFNYPGTIIDCIENIFHDETDFEYIYITLNTNSLNKYMTLFNTFFENQGLIIRYFIDNNTLANELNTILKNPNFQKIKNKSVIPSFPKYDEIFFTDRSGTIEDYSLFFNKLAPFNENINELVTLLNNQRLLLCGISSGNHNEGFLSKNILKYLKDNNINTENILAFTQFCMAQMIRDYKPVQSDKIIMGFGDSTKKEIIKQFLIFLEKENKLPSHMYAMGDHPLDDIPMLKLIYQNDGEIAFISPYNNKDEIIKSLKIWLKFPSSEKEKEYYSMIRNIDENWFWLKDNIYEEAKDFIKKVRK